MSPSSPIFYAIGNTITESLDEILLGLSLNKKMISPKYFYDELGSNLFDEITKQPEYYLTRTEMEIFRCYTAEIVEQLGKDCLLIDCSTIDIQTSIEIGKKASEKGIEMIDAPVSGGVMGAQKATLNIMVGGSKEAYEKALPLLKIMGKNIFHAGDLGSGNGAKICNNMALGIAMIAASESLMLAKRLNIDIKKVHEIMKNASGNSWPISVYPPLPGLIDGTPSNNNYRPGFSAGMMNKDLKLANDCAKSVNAETPLGKMALEIYDQFCKEGNDTKDFSAISKVIGGSAWDYPID